MLKIISLMFRQVFNHDSNKDICFLPGGLVVDCKWTHIFVFKN